MMRETWEGMGKSSESVASHINLTMWDRMDVMKVLVRENLEKVKHTEEVVRPECSIRVGCKVLVLLPHPLTSCSLSGKAPCEVLEKVGSVDYMNDMHDRTEGGIPGTLGHLESLLRFLLCSE